MDTVRVVAGGRHDDSHPRQPRDAGSSVGLREDSTQEKRDRLAGLLAQYGFELEEALPLFGELFSIPPDADAPPLNLTPGQKKQKVYDGFVRMLSIRASEQPVLFVVEDLHWADPSTLELLGLVMDQAPTLSLHMVDTTGSYTHLTLPTICSV